MNKRQQAKKVLFFVILLLKKQPQWITLWTCAKENNCFVRFEKIKVQLCSVFKSRRQLRSFEEILMTNHLRELTSTHGRPLYCRISCKLALHNTRSTFNWARFSQYLGNRLARHSTEGSIVVVGRSKWKH